MRGVEKQNGICGGSAHIDGTRIPIWLLEQARRWGTSDADLLHIYPTLRQENLADAWSYVYSHREEIE